MRDPSQGPINSLERVSLRQRLRKANDYGSSEPDSGNGRLRNVRMGHERPRAISFMMGRFDEERWRKDYQVLFAAHDLIHNHRRTVKIEVAPTEDAAFAVVDIDTLWRNKETGNDFHWKGRVCKIFSKLRNGDWKFYWQTSALNYPVR
jgi:hypothetical protein